MEKGYQVWSFWGVLKLQIAQCVGERVTNLPTYRPTDWCVQNNTKYALSSLKGGLIEEEQIIEKANVVVRIFQQVLKMSKHNCYTACKGSS